jgi:hypothetical protein
MSLPPPKDNYAGEPEYPAPWTTAKPKEGLRDIGEARIICLAPDVCLTPVGNSVVTIPYQIVDYCGDDQSYTPSVRFTGKKAMVLRSSTTCVHGDAPGTRKGVKSGTVEDICEPIGHAPEVRAEGSNVIRHLDRFHMNAKNTVGEAIFVKDTATYPAPEDDDPVPGSLVLADSPGEGVVMSDASPEPLIMGAQYADAGAATIPGSGRGAYGGSVSQPPATTSQPAGQATRLPAIKRKGLFGTISLLDELMGGAVSRARIENGILSELDYYATTPDMGLTPVQMDIVAGGAQEIRETALPAGDYDLAEAIKDHTWTQVHANAQADEEDRADATTGTVRVSGQEQEACDEICKLACECMDEGLANDRSYTACVDRKLRSMDHYDKTHGTYGDGKTPRYPKTPTVDGPRPEVSYKPDASGRYVPVESNNIPGVPSSQIPIKGAPRPDISWWKDGKLWKIFELKFPKTGGGKDGHTTMQSEGEYRRIARDQGLEPDEDLVELDIRKHCDCEGDEGRATNAGLDKCGAI